MGHAANSERPRPNRHWPEEDDDDHGQAILGIMIGVPVGLVMWCLLFLAFGVF